MQTISVVSVGMLLCLAGCAAVEPGDDPFAPMGSAANPFTTGADMMTPLPPYPDPSSDNFNFIDNLDALAARVPEQFPSVQAVSTTSRSYGSYAGQAARGESLSYEERHALNTWRAEHPQVDGVWYGWGPYIWARLRDRRAQRQQRLRCARGLPGRRVSTRPRAPWTRSRR